MSGRLPGCRRMGHRVITDPTAQSLSLGVPSAGPSHVLSKKPVHDVDTNESTVKTPQCVWDSDEDHESERLPWANYMGIGLCWCATVGAMIRQIVLGPGNRLDVSSCGGIALRGRQGTTHLFGGEACAGAWCCSGLRPMRRLDACLPGAGRVLDPAEVEHIARCATEDLRPDLTVVLDAELSVTIHANARRIGWNPRAGCSTNGRGSFSSSWRSAIPSTTSYSTRASRDEIAARVAPRVALLLERVSPSDRLGS